MSSSTITGQIRKIALQILDNNPQGMRYSELSLKILEQGNFNKNTISGATWDLLNKKVQIKLRFTNPLY